MTKNAMEHSKVVTPAEWVAARKELLRKEKEFTRLRDQLSRERRELPWEKVEKKYVFDGPGGKESLGGTEIAVGTYSYLDLVPKGRDEDALAFTMSWVRHHDRYSDGYLADANKPYWPAIAQDSASDCCEHHRP